MEEKHLFFLVHGLGGNPRHLKSLENALVKQFTKGTLVHVSKSNSGFKTMDGAVVCANRALKELLEILVQVAEKGVSIRQISIIGYSFGGIISRYLIGMLEQLNFFETVEPLIFATFATPHVGSVFPSNKFKYKLLNTLGSQLLGVTGGDLFLSNDLLTEIAEQESVYMKGLLRFKYHLLFANAVWDRTVPFWTSYLSTKNPFKDRNQMDMKYYDHLYGQSLDGVKPLGQVPFLIDMKNSTYKENVSEPSADLTQVEKRQRVLLFCLFPVFAPILILLLVGGTVYANLKHSFFYKSLDYQHPILYKKFMDTLGNGNSSPSNIRKLENRFNEDLADLAGETMEDMLLDTTNIGYGNGNIGQDQITKGPPKYSDSLAGLVESSPWDLDISEQTRKNIDNLNQIQWRKYAVKLLHFNAHAEIVDRRLANNQGSEVMKFFVRTSHKLLADYGGTGNKNTSVQST